MSDMPFSEARRLLTEAENHPDQPITPIDRQAMAAARAQGWALLAIVNALDELQQTVEAASQSCEACRVA